MPRDGNGNASTNPIYKAVPGEKVEAVQHNTPIEDIISMLTGSVARNGTGGMQADLNMGGHKVINADEATTGSGLVTLAQVQALMSGAGFGVPTGCGMWLTGTTIPTGWLRANGQAVSRETYDILWEWVQESGNLAGSQGAKTAGQYGPGDGATTFTLPDMENGTGYFVGAVSTGVDPGAVQGSTVGPHTHTGTAASGGAHTHNLSGTAASAGAHTHTGDTNSAGAHTHAVSGTAASNGAHTHTYTDSGGDLATGPIGSGSARNALSRTTGSAGAHTHTVSGTASSAGAHTHSLSIDSGGAHTHSLSGTAQTAGAHTHDVSVAANDGTESRPRNVRYIFVIKA